MEKCPGEGEHFRTQRMVAVGIGKATIAGRREVDSQLIAGISKHFLAYYMRGTYCSPRELGHTMFTVVCTMPRAVSFPKFPSHIRQVC